MTGGYAAAVPALRRAIQAFLADEVDPDVALPRFQLVTIAAVDLLDDASVDRLTRSWMDHARKSCSLVMYDAENKPVARLYLENAWPIKCTLSPLRAGGSDVMQQEWSLTFETIQRVL